jgi:hypothetical protein
MTDANWAKAVVIGLNPSALFHGVGSTAAPLEFFGIKPAGKFTLKPVRVLASATRNALDGHGNIHASVSSPAPAAQLLTAGPEHPVAATTIAIQNFMFVPRSDARNLRQPGGSHPPFM